jgi:hypothetical protein
MRLHAHVLSHARTNKLCLSAVIVLAFGAVRMDRDDQREHLGTSGGTRQR